MPSSVVCNSCASRFDVPDGHARRKIRCPECGVMCEIEEKRRSASTTETNETPRKSRPSAEPASQDAEALAQQLWNDPEPSAPAPKPVEKIAPRPPAQEPPAPRVERRRQVDPVAPLNKVTWNEEDESAGNYDVHGGLPTHCPQCQAVLPPKAAVCTRCGYQFATGTKREREFTPIERSWSSGMSVEKRWSLFYLACGISFLMSLGTAILIGPWYASLGPWVGFVLMIAFMLGTYAITEVKRDTKGRASLKRTWYFAFYRQPTQKIKLGEYESLVTGATLDSGVFAWFIFIFLASDGLTVSAVYLGQFVGGPLYFLCIPLGMIPALAWWYHIIHKDKFHCALAHSHDCPELILYRGADLDLAEEMASTLSDATGLRYARGGLRATDSPLNPVGQEMYHQP